MVESIIIDTDLGSSTDDVATICMAYSYMRQGRAELLGIVVDRMGEQNAVFADVLNTYFGFPDIPIGLCRNGVENQQIFPQFVRKCIMSFSLREQFITSCSFVLQENQIFCRKVKRR